MPSVAYHGSNNIVEHEPLFLDLATASKLAAETAAPKLAKTSATPKEQAAMIEAMRLILLNEIESAKSVLAKAEFSPQAIEEILPLLLKGLTEDA
jgi:hypothetical protein